MLYPLWESREALRLIARGIVKVSGASLSDARRQRLAHASRLQCGLCCAHSSGYICEGKREVRATCNGGAGVTTRGARWPKKDVLTEGIGSRCIYHDCVLVSLTFVDGRWTRNSNCHLVGADYALHVCPLLRGRSPPTELKGSPCEWVRTSRVRHLPLLPAESPLCQACFYMNHDCRVLLELSSALYRQRGGPSCPNEPPLPPLISNHPTLSLAHCPPSPPSPPFVLAELFSILR